MKQVQDYYNAFTACREHEIPPCSDRCPFQMDILNLQDRITRKRFNAAYKSLRDSVVFPGIVSRLCPAYCQKSCVRSAVGTPVQIRYLEQSVIALASRKEPNSYNLPSRDTRIAVIGAGLSGLAFALKMASRKYDVTVFEAEPAIGGQLKELMDPEIYMTEFDLQFGREKYTLHTEAPAHVDQKTGQVSAGGEVYNDFDVIYIATGQGGDDFGFSSCAKAGSAAVFTGGSLRGKDMMYSLADGIAMAAAASDYLQTGVLDMPRDPSPSKCVADEYTLRLTKVPDPADTNQPPTEESCVAEASRCIRCQCDSCRTYCDIVDYYRKSPLKMRDDIAVSVKPAGSLVHKCPSRKYIAACTDCRIFEDLCPEDIELCSMIRTARHQMADNGKMPAGFKQFFLRDMEFSNGEYAGLVKAGSGPYAFFPGCSLGALDPAYVLRPYRWLREHFPGSGLLLKCCGLPADWAGETKLHQQSLDQLLGNWESMGKPTLVTACMSCQRHLKTNLPQIKTISIYELMAQALEDGSWRPEAGGDAGWLESTGDATSPERSDAENWTIFDPCSAHEEAEVRDAVRRICAGANLLVSELPRGEHHGCCGFGGQGSLAQPDFTDHVTDQRAALSDAPYLVYCANCRDVFLGREKKAAHIFDLIFQIDPGCLTPSPGVSTRRENRTLLKQKLLDECWSETMENTPKPLSYELILDEEVRRKANRLRVLDEDICNCLSNAKETGRRSRIQGSERYRAYLEIGAITLWVEYSEEGPRTRRIHNLYTHRMHIELEAIFNGKKTDA